MGLVEQMDEYFDKIKQAEDDSKVDQKEFDGLYAKIMTEEREQMVRDVLAETTCILEKDVHLYLKQDQREKVARNALEYIQNTSRLHYRRHRKKLVGKECGFEGTLIGCIIKNASKDARGALLHYTGELLKSYMKKVDAEKRETVMPGLIDTY